MGRHAASGSDALDWGNAPVAAGRRRTDPPDGLWRGASAEDLSDHPTDPGRARTERAAGGIRTPDGARQLSRSRLPLPPVPMPAAVPTPTPAPAVAAGPRTTMAPFRAVPAPEGRPEPADRETGGGFARTSVPSPRLPAAVPSAVPSATGYGDWTKPSRPTDDYVSGRVGLPIAPPPATTMIPERTVTGRRGGSSAAFDEAYADEYAADYDDYDDYDDDVEPLQVHPSAPLPSAPLPSGPIAIGGRAASRAERQAAEQARLKAAKRNGVPIVDALEAADLVDEEFGVRKPRRVAKGLVAMVVVACGVLGAYSYVSPKTSQAASQTPAASPSAAAAADTAALPPLATTPVAAPPAVVAPVRVPVTVLNATSITGLAAKVAAQLTPKGWPSAGVGAYKAGDVAASTVFFTQGDEKQRQAAVQLVDQFPKLTGPAVRFFQLPAGVSASGLVVVLTGDWQP